MWAVLAGVILRTPAALVVAVVASALLPHVVLHADRLAPHLGEKLHIIIATFCLNFAEF